MYVHTCHGILVEARGVFEEVSSPSFPPRGFWGSNSGHQAWQQVPLPAEPFCGPRKCHFFLTVTYVDTLMHLFSCVLVRLWRLKSTRSNYQPFFTWARTRRAEAERAAPQPPTDSVRCCCAFHVCLGHLL